MTSFGEVAARDEFGGYLRNNGSENLSFAHADVNALAESDNISQVYIALFNKCSLDAEPFPLMRAPACYDTMM